MSDVARALAARLPGGARTVLWSTRKAALRWRRTAFERRGNYALSRPAWHDLDRKLSRYLGFDGGFFVEAGALDGYTQSNTYSLERIRGWRGVLVEPFPRYAREAAHARKNSTVFNCALVDPAFSGTHLAMRFRGSLTTPASDMGNTGSSAVWANNSARPWDTEEHEFLAPARTLTSILDEVSAPEIDFLSLDVEGFEAQVLAGLDLDRYAPRYVLVEATTEPARERSVMAALGDRFREVERLTPLDILFARRERAPRHTPR